MIKQEICRFVSSAKNVSEQEDRMRLDRNRNQSINQSINKKINNRRITKRCQNIT